MVEVLLKHGVDTKAQSSYDQTAIQIALRNQHFEIQSLLQEHEKRLAGVTVSHVYLKKG